MLKEQIESILLNEIAAAGTAYQKLPCVKYADILGNILYAGVWNRYDALQAKKTLRENIQEETRE